MQVNRPRRPARSLQDFRILFTGRAKRGRNPDDRKWWPCIECSGGGRARNASRRVGLTVNGFTFAKKDDRCKACQGTGNGTKEAIKAIYDEEVNKYKVATDKFNRAIAARREALKKLTKEERLALAWLGIFRCPTNL